MKCFLKLILPLFYLLSLNILVIYVQTFNMQNSQVRSHEERNLKEKVQEGWQFETILKGIIGNDPHAKER